MFDRVELKLRWYGSKSVVKYPRCSLLRQSTYADAEVQCGCSCFHLAHMIQMGLDFSLTYYKYVTLEKELYVCFSYAFTTCHSGKNITACLFSSLVCDHCFAAAEQCFVKS
jgi:hypothetical protein